MSFSIDVSIRSPCRSKGRLFGVRYHYYYY